MDRSGVGSIREVESIRVEVREVIYMPTLEAPSAQPYPFVYIIAIENLGAEAVTFFGRKWVVSEEGGDVSVVEGEGIVGQKPRGDPGEVSSYN